MHTELPSPPADRLCPRCATFQPLSAFKRRSKAQGGGPSWCRECVNAADRQRRQRKRDGVVRSLGRHVRHNADSGRLAAVVAAYARRIGGVQRLGELLAENFLKSQRGKCERDRIAALRLAVDLIEAASRTS